MTEPIVPAASIVPVEPIVPADPILPFERLDPVDPDRHRDPAFIASEDPASELPPSLATGDMLDSHVVIVAPDSLPLAPVESIILPPHRLPRTPNFGDAMVFLLLLLIGLVVTVCITGVAVYLHAFGIASLVQLQAMTGVLLGMELLVYAIAVGAAVPFFSMMWHRGFWDGMRWHAATALRLRWRLVLTALGCNVLAMVANQLLPFPTHAPINDLFKTTSQAWMLFAFGVIVAPFFEEIIFRGFLLPAFSTAWDWCAERIRDQQPPPLDINGNPVWSTGAMVFSSIIVSALFALMHAGQISNAWGPLSVLFAVSLVLCIVRLRTRSLAASNLVHAAYNFVLFAVMLVQTDGFRHLDKI